MRHELASFIGKNAEKDLAADPTRVFTAKYNAIVVWQPDRGDAALLAQAKADLHPGGGPPGPAPQANLPPHSTVLRIHGSNTLGAKLTPELARAFLQRAYPGAAVQSYVTERKAHTGADGATHDEILGTLLIAANGTSQPPAVEIKSHGSKTAFDEAPDVKQVGLRGGHADIGQSSSKIKTEVVEALASAGLGKMDTFGPLRTEGAEHRVALDGVAVFVNDKNPIEDMDLDTLKRIFKGEVTDWSQVPLGRKMPPRAATGSAVPSSSTAGTTTPVPSTFSPAWCSAERSTWPSRLSNTPTARSWSRPWVLIPTASASQASPTPPPGPDALPSARMRGAPPWSPVGML
nr:substrate-binding domain-containing protein [Verrucomicrobium spinosum]